MESYCSYARKRRDHHREHHDTEHGFPPADDDDLFRRLVLEISQAGLSFDIALKRKRGIYEAFNSVSSVAAFSEKDAEALMKNPGIIRNRLKIKAAVENARAVQKIQKEHGSFRSWLSKQGDLELDEWTALFREKFFFVGKEIVNEFLMSACYIEGAHDRGCPVLKKTGAG